ncbi:MAG TPA: roadblock/LC7 domain-containing protein [Polyangiaceae bacterium]
MKNIQLVTKLPEVSGVALSDTSGALIECIGQMDGEVTGAIHAYVAQALSKAGDVLGIGAFERASLSSSAGTCLIFLHEDAVLGVNINAKSPTALVENKICEILAK